MPYNYNKADFLCSYFDARELPLEKKPEVVFVGRSNAGKSSMINKLVNRKKFAYTSSKPGKTAAINYFSIDNSIYIVDLPGYGFAQRSKTERRGWGSLIETYFSLGRDMRLVVLLIDIRHGPTEDDVMMYEYLMSKTVPFCVAATKSDKVSKTAAKEMVESISEQFGVNAFAFSSENGEGVDTLKAIIEDLTEAKDD
ncbi:MAG: YihA family ribosome biogenesis GTP-binding protein [Clostridia bacterium]|nr:YihA family ribosome biogenesis GTP-binding protein [Clostridia bacterium]MBQ4627746.1 YihA family ribosome biogenesis GTP-binding protein [Clostridia bacterium]